MRRQLRPFPGPCDGLPLILYTGTSLLLKAQDGNEDLEPNGRLRIIAGMQALNGFALFCWSVSATFLFMQKTWDWQEVRSAEHRRCGKKR